MDAEKVSIVVPIYNVEKYIHRCINSILNQTYKNIEVILVDDGSPDQCGDIADQYANRDTRVKTYHKPNGGLSDARNYGMYHVTGHFTMFVDSDDWLEVDAIERMINHSKSFNADVVQSAFYYAHESYLLFDQRYYAKSGDLLLLDNETLMKELIKNETVKNFAWGKLYKTSLIKDIPFKKGVLFEDVYWAYQVMHRVKMFIHIQAPLYHYLQREDSIVSTYTERNLDILEGLRERHAFIEKHYKSLTADSYRALLETSLIHYNLLTLNRKVDRKGKHRRKIQHTLNMKFEKYIEAAEKEAELSRQLRLFYIHPYLNIFYLGGRKIGRKLTFRSRTNGLEKIKVPNKNGVQLV
ncbi:glycosyltransferase family 2 protein [Halobacillus trueperi]|uniref:glycosyltransferase family 2 protein n=1 Tax=Halobacillus trueperi TaxID=156205 RepID=UPI003735A47A